MVEAQVGSLLESLRVIHWEDPLMECQVGMVLEKLRVQNWESHLVQNP